MSLAYYFHMQSVPRTTTRADWYAAWRKVRVQRKDIEANNKRELELLRTNADTIPAHIKRDMIDRMIYPPVALGPFM